MPEEKSGSLVIAFLGLGLMGTPMVRRLLSAGFDVRVWNRSMEKATLLENDGAIVAMTPAQAAKDADVVVTMLVDGATVEAVMSGDDGALGTMRDGAVWIQMSSVGVEWTTRLARMVKSPHILFVDAPVSGSIVPAQTGSLLILASGPDRAREIVGPVLDALGRKTYWLGEAGAGNGTKVVLNNWLVDLVAVVAQTLSFATALNLNPSTIIDILSDAPIGSPYGVAKARQMLAGDFAPSFSLRNALKDADLALDAAAASGVTLSLTNSFVESWRDIASRGAGENDVAVVYEGSER
jgi:3-hydroxyisobutyrate dehydrogenase